MWCLLVSVKLGEGGEGRRVKGGREEEKDGRREEGE